MLKNTRKEFWIDIFWAVLLVGSVVAVGVLFYELFTGLKDRPNG